MSNRGKGQSKRLGRQHELAGGPLGIFGEEAKKHDAGVRDVVDLILMTLRRLHSDLEFSFRNAITKKEVNEKLQ